METKSISGPTSSGWVHIWSEGGFAETHHPIPHDPQFLQVKTSCILNTTRYQILRKSRNISIPLTLCCAANFNPRNIQHMPAVQLAGVP